MWVKLRDEVMWGRTLGKKDLEKNIDNSLSEAQGLIDSKTKSYQIL